MMALRLIYPALLDFNVLSCRTLSCKASRVFSTSIRKKSSDNKNYEINPLFENRNPRAMEFMALAPKQQGWKFQAPRKDFYHKLIFDMEGRHCAAQVVHCSGSLVIDASAKERCMQKYLYKTNDVSAAWNVGRLLARRMLEAGITSVFYEEVEEEDGGVSEKKKMFLQALQDNEIVLREPDVVEAEEVPGLDYESYNRLGEKRTYQDDYQKL